MHSQSKSNPLLTHNYFTPVAVTVEIADTEYSVAEDRGSAVITIRKNGLITLPITLIILTTIDGSAVGKLSCTHDIVFWSSLCIHSNHIVFVCLSVQLCFANHIIYTV